MLTRLSGNDINTLEDFFFKLPSESLLITSLIQISGTVQKKKREGESRPSFLFLKVTYRYSFLINCRLFSKFHKVTHTVVDQYTDTHVQIKA